MTTILLVWYSLGWVAAGLDFAIRWDFAMSQDDKIPFVICFLFAPVIVLGNIIFLAEKSREKQPSNTQYLWRRKP